MRLDIARAPSASASASTSSARTGPLLTLSWPATQRPWSKRSTPRCTTSESATSAADFLAFADALEQVVDRGLVVVLGSQAAIEAANAERAGWLDVSKVL